MAVDVLLPLLQTSAAKGGRGRSEAVRGRPPCEQGEWKVAMEGGGGEMEVEAVEGWRCVGRTLKPKGMQGAEGRRAAAHKEGYAWKVARSSIEGLAASLDAAD